MKTSLIIGLSACLLLGAAVDAQQTYDGRNGPHVFGKPGEQVYIRGQNEGPYTVPGVGGTFQNSAGGVHAYTDERGNTYVHNKNGGKGQSTHSISGPDLVAHRGPPSAGGNPSTGDYRGSRQTHISRGDGRSVSYGPGGFHASGADGRTVSYARGRRQTHIQRADGRSVSYGPGGFHASGADGRSVSHSRGRRDTYIGRPDGRSVSLGQGGFHASGADGRSVSYSRGRRYVDFSDPDSYTLTYTPNGIHGLSRTRTNPNAHSRQRRARVQGENFVARDDQAGVWNDRVSVWKRPDGRTVTVDAAGNVITSGSPNGRGPQYYRG